MPAERSTGTASDEAADLVGPAVSQGRHSPDKTEAPQTHTLRGLTFCTPLADAYP